MNNNQSKFNALAPEVLTKNRLIYTEALDYAFNNRAIKNIAITGIYGAGKSSVWNTYIHERKIKNIITVSLGIYKDSDSNVVVKEENQEGIDNENRVERQLINQILSQIESKKIPLSKYRFKANKSKCTLVLQTMMLISMITSIILWMIKDTIIPMINMSYSFFDEVILIIVCTIFLLIPLFYYFYIFNQGYKFRLSKITIKGAEANINDSEKNDESILDRDIKELVYLLLSSGTKVVVFEDLDRYENIAIYTKLRELNFLLNKYVNINGCEAPVRFIYILKDSLFFSKDRTKFFDFILPIVPIVDSKTSENKLIDLLKDVDDKLDRRMLANISLYVDDMRLLKNIVNEYIVYSEVIPLDTLDLESNKLFALITFKNIFPNEFDLLQEDTGVIRAMFNELEVYRKKAVIHFNEKIEEISKKVEFINNSVADNKFDAMALLIPNNFRLDTNSPQTWGGFIKSWSQEPEREVVIHTSGGIRYFLYETFINDIILIDDDRRDRIKKFSDDRESEINKLNSNLNQIKRQIRDIEIYSYKDLISMMTTQERDELFSSDEFGIVSSHYFPLIRFLIVNGLLDETYWYYKGLFDVDTSNTLKRNDTIYMKGLLEGKKLDTFLDIETPHEIIARLNLVDFSRDNILNKKILEACLKEHHSSYVIGITDSVDVNDNYKSLIQVLDEFNLDSIKIYTDILLKTNNINRLIAILDSCEEKDNPTFNKLLISILMSKDSNQEDLKQFNVYVEKNESLVSLVPENGFDAFIRNISKMGIKFENLWNSKCEKNRLRQIEEINAYRLSPKNVVFVTKTLLGKTIRYGNLLNEIANSEDLVASKTYIESYFNSFISAYIEESSNEDLFSNDEEVLIRILQADISEDYKLKYLEKNEVLISQLSKLNGNDLSVEMLDCLLRKNKIKFSSENISVYWSMITEYDDIFTEYIDRNLNKNNYKDIFTDNSPVCNTLINSDLVSDKVFRFSVECADKKIKCIDEGLTQDRVNILIREELFEVTENNIRVLLTNSYNAELVLIASLGSQDVEDEVISILLQNNLSEELIYDLVNSKISDENSLKLIEKIKDRVLIEKIPLDRHCVVETIINQDLSDRNVEYICNNFNTFKLKDMFIEVMDNRGKLVVLDDKNLNEAIMEHILNSSNITVDTKVALILIKIKNHISIDVLKRYMTLVQEIAALLDVWNNKYPALDNDYKEKIGNELKNSGYVRLRSGRPYFRIMPANNI